MYKKKKNEKQERQNFHLIYSKNRIQEGGIQFITIRTQDIKS